jgi:hypothetical protein
LLSEFTPNTQTKREMMIFDRLRVYRLLIAASLALVALTAFAEPTAVVVPGPSSGGIAFVNPVHSGWQFVPVKDLLVSAIGFGDVGRDGLAVSHQVALFRVADSQLLASVSVSSSDTLQGFYRYAAIPQVALSAGVAYQLVAGLPSVLDAEVTVTLATTVFNDVIWQGFSSGNGAMPMPVGTTTNPLIFDDGHFTRVSSSMLYEPATPIPEPSTYLLLGSGLLVIALRRHASCRSDSKLCA